MECDLHKHVDSIGEDQSAAVDVTAIFQKMAVRVLINVAFGASLSEDDLADYGKRSAKLLKLVLEDMMRYPLSGSWFGKLLGVRKGIDAQVARQKNLCRKLVQDRINESAEDKSRRVVDLLDALVDLEGSDEEAMTSNCLIFSIAGSHTTAAAAACAVYKICGNSKVYQTVQGEIDRVCVDKDFKYEHVSQLTYLHQVWKETLRFQSLADLLRIAKCDLTLPDSGVRIAAGTQVYSVLAGTHRDRNLWKCADEFIPERWDPATGDGPHAPKGAYLPFSAGQKNCPGSFLADFEGVLILANLLGSFDIELAVPREEVVLVSGYANSAGTHDPAGPPGNLTVGVPIRIQRRKRG